MLEYLPSTTRATMIIAIELFWSFGSIFEYLLAMIVVPTLGWRWLTGLSALPISIVALCMYVSMRCSSLHFFKPLSLSNAVRARITTILRGQRPTRQGRARLETHRADQSTGTAARQTG